MNKLPMKNEVLTSEMCRRKPMKKLITLAIMATFVAGTAFAQRQYTATPDATFPLGVGGAAARPPTTNKDDLCDIGVPPAATPPLPYFPVETSTPPAPTVF